MIIVGLLCLGLIILGIVDRICECIEKKRNKKGEER